MTQYYTTLWLAKGTENKTERKQVRISADWRQSIKLFTSMSEELNSGLPSQGVLPHENDGGAICLA